MISKEGVSNVTEYLMENNARVTWIMMTLRTIGLIAAFGISNRTSTDNHVSASSLWAAQVSCDILFRYTTSLFLKMRHVI